MVTETIVDIFSDHYAAHSSFTKCTKAVFLRNFRIVYQYKSGTILSALSTSTYFLLFFYVSSLLPNNTITLNGKAVTSVSYILLGMLCIEISTRIMHKSMDSFVNEMHQGTFEYLSLQNFGLRNYFLSEILFEVFFALIISFICYTPIILIYSVFQGVAISFSAFLSLLLLITSYILFFFPLALLTASLTILFKRAKEVAFVITNILQLLSGALFPISFLPNWLQHIAKASPLTMFVTAIRLIIFSGETIVSFSIWKTVLTLIFCAVITYLLFLLIFSKIFKIMQQRGEFSIY